MLEKVEKEYKDIGGAEFFTQKAREEADDGESDTSSNEDVVVSEAPSGITG